MRLYARTNSEAHLYMDLRPCSCGDIEFERQSAVMTEDDVLCSRYSGPCRTCGTQRMFIFELPEKIRPVRGDGVDFGGSDPSQLLDPGEWMAVADYYAKLDPGTREDLDIARAAIEEVLKFVPPGGERVPDDAFRTERGRAVRDAEPGRFRRVRLEAVLGAYRDLLAKASGQPVDAKPPGAGKPLFEGSLQMLLDAFASTVAKQQGFEGADLQHQVSDLKSQLQSLVTLFEIKAKEELQRRQTSAELERLLQGIAQTGTSAGKAIAEHREAIAQAFRGIDLARISEGLQVLIQWLRNPPEKPGAIRDLMADLQTTMGPMAGMTPEQEDELRRERIRKEVRASLEQIFKKPVKPDEPDKAGKPENTNTPENAMPDEAGKPDEASKPDEAGKPDETGKPDEADKN